MKSSTSREDVFEFLLNKLDLTSDEQDFLYEVIAMENFYCFEEFSTVSYIKNFFDNEFLYCLLKYTLEELQPIAQSCVKKLSCYLGIKVEKPSCYKR